MMLLLGCLKFQSVDPTLAYIALLAVGAVEFACAQIPATKRRREAFIVLTVAGAALMLAAVPSHFTDNHIAILWLVGTEVFLIAGSIVKEALFRRLGLLTGLLVGIRLIGFDFRDLVNLRLHGERLELSPGILFAFCAVDLFERFAKLNDEYVIHAKSPDEELSQLAIQSLTGYFRSHPLPSERLAQANRIIAQEHWESRTERKPFRVEYEVHNGEFVK